MTSVIDEIVMIPVCAASVYTPSETGNYFTVDFYNDIVYDKLTTGSKVLKCCGEEVILMVCTGDRRT
jgi:hypothetical protein